MSTIRNRSFSAASIAIGVFYGDVLKIRARVKELARRDADVIVAATHSHQTPDTMGCGDLKKASAVSMRLTMLCCRTDSPSRG